MSPIVVAETDDFHIRGVLVGSYPRDDFHQVWLSMSTEKLIRLSVRAPEHGPTPTATTLHTVPEPPPRTDAGDEPESEMEAEEEHWTEEPRRVRNIPQRRPVLVPAPRRPFVPPSHGTAVPRSLRPTDPRTSSWLTC